MRPQNSLSREPPLSCLRVGVRGERVRECSRGCRLARERSRALRRLRCGFGRAPRARAEL